MEGADRTFVNAIGYSISLYASPQHEFCRIVAPWGEAVAVSVPRAAKSASFPPESKMGEQG
jgi:hypothetical protein